MPNELFEVGDCVISKVCPTMIGKIVHISGECEHTNIIVEIDGDRILADADYWRKVGSDAK